MLVLVADRPTESCACSRRSFAWILITTRPRLHRVWRRESVKKLVSVKHTQRSSRERCKRTPPVWRSIHKLYAWNARERQADSSCRQDTFHKIGVSKNNGCCAGRRFDLSQRVGSACGVLHSVFLSEKVF